MCDDGSYVCDESDCPTGSWSGDACDMPNMTFHLDNAGSVLYNSSEDIVTITSPFLLLVLKV